MVSVMPISFGSNLNFFMETDVVSGATIAVCM